MFQIPLKNAKAFKAIVSIFEKNSKKLTKALKFGDLSAFAGMPTWEF